MSSGDAMTAPVHDVPVDAIAGVLREHYGVECRALERLGGECDQNYRVADQKGRSFLCKITHPSEDHASTRQQTQVLESLEQAAPDLPVQHVIRALSGERWCELVSPEGARTYLRLLSYLPGVPMHQVPPSPGLNRSLGGVHASLCAALRDTHLSVPDRTLLWDLGQAGQLPALLPHINDEHMRNLVARRLEDFLQNVLPVLGGLRRQLIHNDLNPHNILADASTGRVTGIIDFGDMVEAPLVQDVAIAASYLFSGDAPIQACAEYVRAFDVVYPLERDEIAVLFPVMMARLAMTVVITEWRAAMHPANRSYILRNNAHARAGLLLGARLTNSEVLAKLQPTARDAIAGD